MKKNHKQSLEDKVWYRLFKVVFLIALLLTLWLGVLFSSMSFPSKSFDPLIACDDGTTLIASKMGLYISEHYVNVYEKDRMRELCGGGYELVPRYNEEGSLKTAILSGIAATLVGVLLVIIVKKTILYILIGGNWLKL